MSGIASGSAIFAPTAAGTPVDTDVVSVNGRTGAVTLVESDIANLTTDLSAKAPIASPTFTGVPAAPTASGGTNTTQMATCAFVVSAVASYLPLTGGVLTGNLSVGANTLTASGTINFAGSTLQMGSGTVTFSGQTRLATNGLFHVNTSQLAIDSSGNFITVTGTTFCNTTGLVASAIASGTVPTARLGSGAASSSTFLRGDQAWSTVDAGLLTGSTLASGVTGSSLTSIGILGVLNLLPQYATPTTGTTVTMTSSVLIIEPAGALLALTVQLPASPTNGQMARFTCTAAVTTLTLDGNGNTVVAAPASLAANGHAEFVFRASTSKWYWMA